MYDVITIGSAVVDIFVYSEALQIHKQGEKNFLCQLYGEKLGVEQLHICSGGAATNAAVGFQRLGFKVAPIAEIGQDMLAQAVLHDLKENRISDELLIKERSEQTGGSVILVGEDGGRTALVYRGAAAQLDKTDIPVEVVTSARWIHLSSLGGQAEVITMLFNLVHHYQLSLSWNPGKAELELLKAGQLLVPRQAVSVLFVNLQEWEMIAADHEYLRSAIPTIVITDGARGGEILRNGHESITFESKKVQSVDDTGAGDAFATGTVAGLLSGLDVKKASEWGVANASSVVQKVGAKAGLLNREQMRLATT